MTTPNLQLAEVPEAIREASDEINDSFWSLDAIVQLSVKDKDLTEAPESVVQGDRYIVAEGALGTWYAKDRSIAYMSPTGWLYFRPRKGWKAYVEDEERDYVYDGTAWQQEGDLSAVTFLTEGDETSTFPASRKLVAGANVTIDATTPGELVISSSGGGSGTVSPLTTKGDLYTHDGSANARLPVGTNSQVLTADATATTGQRWKTRYFLEPVANGDSDDPEMVFSDGDIVTVPVELE